MKRSRKPKPADEAPAASGAAPARRRSWKRTAVSWGVQLLVVLVILWGATRWQSRRLLAARTAAPAFSLAALDGSTHQLAEAAGHKLVLYFFAPWCRVCAYSSHNVNALRASRTEAELTVLAVGLDWEDEADLRRFATEHELSVPVLKGDEALGRAYHVDTFPTIYIIDEEGRVEDRVVGYTTELGLRLRSL
jgi:peroxiredoxin